MVVTTFMIHQMMRETQLKKTKENKKLQLSLLDSDALRLFLKNADKLESDSQKIISSHS